MVETCENNWALRAVYLVTAGWGLGIIVAGVAWFLMLSIIGVPVGLWLIDRMPTFVSLRPECLDHPREWLFVIHGEQRPWWHRLIYFLLFGLWASAVWMAVAYAFIFTVIGIPLSFRMFERVPQVATLHLSD